MTPRLAWTLTGLAILAWIGSCAGALAYGSEVTDLVVASVVSGTVMVLLFRTARNEPDNRPTLLWGTFITVALGTAVATVWGALLVGKVWLLAGAVTYTGFTAAAGVYMRTAMFSGPRLYWRRALFAAMAFGYALLAWSVNPGWPGFVYGMTAIGAAVLWFVIDYHWRKSWEPILTQFERRAVSDNLMAEIGQARIRFWTCPIRSHGDRTDGRGWPVVTVEWRGAVAHCTAPGCGRTSAGVRR